VASAAAAVHSARVAIHVDRILVPLDHSPGSEAVIEFACAVARGLGSSLAVLHVYEPPNAMIGVVPGASVGGETAAEHDAGVALLDRASALAHASGCTIVDRILERGSSPTQAILSHARVGKFSLIVMGTHARSGVSRLVMGSVAEQVMRAAPCPILMVHLRTES
jgi:nucleotide-binding universal stress UspA family protein